MEIIAKYNKAKSSSQKIRLIADMIRGKPVIEVLNILTHHNKKAAYLIKKVLNSAVANADHNFGIDEKYLFIKKIFVDQGPVMKRMMPRAKGRSDRILKRTSHITIVLSNK